MTYPALERPEWLDTLTDSLAEQSRLDQVVALRPGIGARPAAVLILIGEGPQGPEIMFVERAAGLRKHAGQIAFPGGAADADDRDLESKSWAYCLLRTWRSAGLMSQR
jgi:hypothetical protein